MNVKELVDKLNRIINNTDVSKIHTHDEFHSLVEQTIKPLLPKGLVITTWRITNGEDYEDEIITYDRDFKKYENCKWASRGNFSNIRFSLISATIENIDTKQLNKYFTEKHLQERVEKLKRYIAGHKADLEKAEKELKDLTA